MPFASVQPLARAAKLDCYTGGDDDYTFEDNTTIDIPGETDVEAVFLSSLLVTAPYLHVSRNSQDVDAYVRLDLDVRPVFAHCAS